MTVQINQEENAQESINRPIILIGFMGCGKSCVSAILAKRLKRKQLDTDAQIEAEQDLTVSRIFEAHGEPYFRELERDLLVRLCREKEPMVIATGGGLAAQPQNVKLLKKLGTVIYLRVQPQTVLKRLKDDQTRPLLMGGDREEKVRGLLGKREPVYLAAADFCIETDAMTPEEIADRIMEIVGIA